MSAYPAEKLEQDVVTKSFLQHYGTAQWSQRGALQVSVRHLWESALSTFGSRHYPTSRRPLGFGIWESYHGHPPQCQRRGNEPATLRSSPDEGVREHRPARMTRDEGSQ
ncbi:hypothetical protein MHU86_5302 [Fragilaria crotonensis]|nr:hypothetical protein MHU86_5302 [Fragilaria crotonensis]